MLVREIIKPTEPNVTVRLPQEMVGKTVELIAFEIEEPNPSSTFEQRLAKIRALTKNSRIDLSGFTFNRDDANNYDD